MNWKKIVIIFLIISSGIFYYQLTGKAIYQMQNVFIVRVLDGDTVELQGGEKIRLLGINTPEKNMFYFEEAKLFLEKLVLNKSVGFELKDTDKYGRWLGYIFVGDKMINEKILNEGLASLYVYEPDEYFEKLEKAEEFARGNGLGIWRKSSQDGCVELRELKFQEDERCNNKEKLVLFNNCGEIDVLIKDDATHIYLEVLQPGLNEFNFSCVWNDAGDSIFIFDEKGLLLFWRY